MAHIIDGWLYVYGGLVAAAGRKRSPVSSRRIDEVAADGAVHALDLTARTWRVVDTDGDAPLDPGALLSSYARGKDLCVIGESPDGAVAEYVLDTQTGTWRAYAT